MAEQVWLAASYHIPLLYSGRVPLTSVTNGQVVPAPGPGTVRLAMTRTAIEFRGIEIGQHRLFPVIREATVRIQPPERVAVSSHPLHFYKYDQRYNQQRSFGYREFCHAEGPLTVFVKIPIEFEAEIAGILADISYWGQADSFATCLNIDRRAPQAGYYAVPLDTVQMAGRLQPFWCCLLTEFRDTQVEWTEVTSVEKGRDSQPIMPQLFIWPLALSEQHSSHRLYRFCSLAD